ncbi:hypothetical protein BU107_07010 [Staphylococcus xylosus]|uniref:major capsid protein n=1 Tax=Staphylococcus xylosus TaxID=1288 RepID=UPI000E688A3A|nr:major capsid protein [Staphylococcus xylosus]RIM87755.1 hypothetical protein BU107_07010 [Staphylococcus xylosus]
MTATITTDAKLQQPTLQAFIENLEPKQERRLASVLPSEETSDIKNVYDIIEQSGVKAGSITGFNSGTPLRSKGQVKQAMVELSKIAHGYLYTEDEMNRYKNPRNNDEKEALVRKALMSIRDLSEGIEDTLEYLRANQVYRGVFEYEDPKSEVKVKFDLDLEEGTKSKAGDFSRDDVNPLAVLQEQVEKYREMNHQQSPAFMVMTRKTLAKIKRNKNVVLEIYGKETGKRIVKDSDLKEMFNELELPELAIENGFVTFEGPTEDITKPLLENDKVVMHAERLGKTLQGPAADNNFKTGKYVVNIIGQDPVSEKTLVGQVAMPVVQNLKGISILEADEQKGVEDSP